MMRLFLNDGPSHLQILPRHHVQEFRDVASAREFLRPLLADPGNAAAIREAIGFANWQDGELLEAVAQKLVTENLQVVRCTGSYVASLLGTAAAAGGGGGAASATAAQQQQQQAQRTTPLQDEDAALAERATAPGAEETHWIEIELIDDEGKPVANESYFVELPDGSSLSGRTDASGRARVEGVDPGTAKVTFPDRDRSAYEKGGA